MQSSEESIILQVAREFGTNHAWRIHTHNYRHAIAVGHRWSSVEKNNKTMTKQTNSSDNSMNMVDIHTTTPYNLWAWRKLSKSTNCKIVTVIARKHADKNSGALQFSCHCWECLWHSGTCLVCPQWEVRSLTPYQRWTTAYSAAKLTKALLRITHQNQALHVSAHDLSGSVRYNWGCLPETSWNHGRLSQPSERSAASSCLTPLYRP